MLTSGVRGAMTVGNSFPCHWYLTRTAAAERESGRNLLALGLNPHGKPGLYFTQNMN